jgi:restriction endonuclease BglII
MQLTFRWSSYRFAEQVLNSRLYLKQEIEQILMDRTIDVRKLSRPDFHAALKTQFKEKGGEDQPKVFDEPGELLVRMDFLKDRVGIEVGFGHVSSQRGDWDF